MEAVESFIKFHYPLNLNWTEFGSLFNIFLKNQQKSEEETKPYSNPNPETHSGELNCIKLYFEGLSVSFLLRKQMFSHVSAKNQIMESK